MKRIVVVLVVLAVFAAGCTRSASKTSSGGGTRVVTDISGRRVEIPVDVKSVVCIHPGALRYTTYLGAADLLMGVDAGARPPSIFMPFTYVNAGLFAGLPVTGNGETAYEEEIVKLVPDIIVAMIDGASADSLQQRLGIPVIAVTYIDNAFDEVSYRTFRLLGDIYGRQERAEELINYFTGMQADLQRRTVDIPEDDKPAVYVGGVSYKGAHGFDGTEANYAPLAAIGAHNLAGSTGQPRAYNIDLEQVLKWDPDIIFLDFSGMGLIDRHYADNPGFYNSLTAVREGRVHSQISFRYNSVNLETALADTYYAGKVVFPEQFKDVDPVAKADEIFEMMLGMKFYDVLRQNGYEFREMRLGE